MTKLLKKSNLSILGSVVVLLMLFQFFKSSSSLQEPKPLTPNSNANVKATAKSPDRQVKISEVINKDGYEDLPFMPKMGNETLKAELGNAAWKLFHTILARYPEKPTPEQRDVLTNYIKYFAQVYPCGDCARHFVKLLEQYPPQTSSRQVAAVWGCHVHNQVNLRLGHEIYDCSHIIEDYDCGCGEDEKASEQIDEMHVLFQVEDEDKQSGG